MAKQDRGFRSMDRDVQRRISSMGGKTAHAKGVAHQWTSSEARVAGRKGGIAAHRRQVPADDNQERNG
jgi:general stress protein YciG